MKTSFVHLLSALSTTLETARRKAVELALLLWAAFCLGLFIYFPGHRSGVHHFLLEDFRPAVLGRIAVEVFVGDILRSFLAVMLFSASVVGWGTVILNAAPSRVNRRDKRALSIYIQRYATAFVLGQCILSIAFMLSLIFAGHLSQWFTWLMWGMGLLLLIFHTIRTPLPSSVREKHQLRLENEWLGWLAIGFFILTLCYSSSRLSYDAATQYFAQAKMIALTQQPLLLALKDAFAPSALFVNSIYAAIIQIFGDQAARMYSWVNGLVILAFSLLIGERAGLSAKAFPLFLALVMTSTAFVDLLGDGKIELACTSSLLASAYWLLQAWFIELPGGFFLSGLLASWAVVARPYNLPLLGLFFLFSLSLLALNESRSSRLAVRTRLVRGGMYFIFPFLLCGFLYLLANAKLLNDPLAPLSVLNLGKEDWPFYPEPIWWLLQFLFYPIVVTFFGALDTLGHVTPLFLAFIPVLFVRQVCKEAFAVRHLNILALAALGTLYVWIGILGTIHILELRYVLFLWIILLLALAQAIGITLSKSPLLKANASVVFSLALLFMGWRTLTISLATYSPVVEGEARCFDIPMCRMLEVVNRSAGPSERLLVLGGYRYYLRTDLLTASSILSDYRLLERAARQNREAFWKEVQNQGYRFILYESYYLQYILRFRSLPILNQPPNWLPFATIYEERWLNYIGHPLTIGVYSLGSLPTDHRVFP